MAVLLLAMPTKLWSLDRKRMWTHCFVETVDQAVLLRCFPALPFDLTFMVFQTDEYEVSQFTFCWFCADTTLDRV